MGKIPTWIWIVIIVLSILIIGYTIYYYNQKKKVNELTASSGTTSVWDLITNVQSQLNKG